MLEFWVFTAQNCVNTQQTATLSMVTFAGISVKTAKANILHKNGYFQFAFASVRCHCSLRNLLGSEACCIFLCAASEQMMRPILLNLFPFLCWCQRSLLLSGHPQPTLWQKNNISASGSNVTWRRHRGAAIVHGQACSMLSFRWRPGRLIWAC